MYGTYYIRWLCFRLLLLMCFWINILRRINQANTNPQCCHGYHSIWKFLFWSNIEVISHCHRTLRSWCFFWGLIFFTSKLAFRIRYLLGPEIEELYLVRDLLKTNFNRDRFTISCEIWWSEKISGESKVDVLETYHLRNLDSYHTNLDDLDPSQRRSISYLWYTRAEYDEKSNLSKYEFALTFILN